MMNIVLLVLGVLTLLYYVSPGFRLWTSTTLGLPYNPNMDMICIFASSALLMHTLGFVPGLLIVCVAMFARRSF